MAVGVDGADYIEIASISVSTIKADIMTPCNLVMVRGLAASLDANQYIGIFDVATTTAVTLGTTIPLFSVKIIDGVTEGDGLPTKEGGLNIKNGIVVAATIEPISSTRSTDTVHVTLAFI